MVWSSSFRPTDSVLFHHNKIRRSSTVHPVLTIILIFHHEPQSRTHPLSAHYVEELSHSPRICLTRPLSVWKSLFLIHLYIKNPLICPSAVFNQVLIVCLLFCRSQTRLRGSRAPSPPPPWKVNTGHSSLSPDSAECVSRFIKDWLSSGRENQYLHCSKS